MHVSHCLSFYSGDPNLENASEETLSPSKLCPETSRAQKPFSVQLTFPSLRSGLTVCSATSPSALSARLRRFNPPSWLRVSGLSVDDGVRGIQLPVQARHCQHCKPSLPGFTANPFWQGDRRPIPVSPRINSYLSLSLQIPILVAWSIMHPYTLSS